MDKPVPHNVLDRGDLGGTSAEQARLGCAIAKRVQICLLQKAGRTVFQATWGLLIALLVLERTSYRSWSHTKHAPA